MKIALDLGGTNVRAAIVDGDKIVDRRSAHCPALGTCEEVIDCIISLIDPLISDKIEGIGAGVPSIVDRAHGIVYNVANIPSWQKVALGEILQKRFNLPVAIDNDCNCFALGESLYGAGRGHSHVVGITLGTGIGAGLVLNGTPYGGVMSGAGEVGCIPFRDSDFEHYCSSMFFRDIHNTTAAQVAERVACGDSEAVKIWNEFGANLGEFMCALLYAYAPEAIIVGGGIAASFDLFKQSMKETLEARFPYPIIAEQCTITRAELQDANLLGAAALLDQK